MNSAALRALAIPELLEAVLLELPTLDVLKSKRVSKIFKAVIDESTKLQQHLFFKQRLDYKDGMTRLNPLLSIALRKCGLVGSLETDDPGSSTILSVPAEKRDCCYVQSSCSLTFKIDYPHSTPLEAIAWPKSYQKMFITDFPISSEMEYEASRMLKGFEEVHVRTLGDTLKGMNSPELAFEMVGWKHEGPLASKDSRVIYEIID